MSKNVKPDRAMTLKELAAAYGISTKTMRKWIWTHRDKIGSALGRYFLYFQVQIIVSIFGPFVITD